jgi:hypothetical protein
MIVLQIGEEATEVYANCSIMLSASAVIVPAIVLMFASSVCAWTEPILS